MKILNSKKKLIVLCVGIFAGSGAQAQNSSYGEVYTAIQDRTPILDLSLGYRFGVSNPFQYSHGLSGQGRFYFSGRGIVLFEYSKYFSSLNEFTGDARTSLTDAGFGAAIAKPLSRFTVGMGVVILDGVLNFFGKKVVPFDVSLSGIGGRASYESSDARTLIGLQLDFSGQFYKSLGFAISAQPTIEHSSVYGTLLGADVLASLFYRFY